MINISHTRNIELIKGLLKEDYKSIADDSNGPFEEWFPYCDDRHIHLVSSQNNEITGLFIFILQASNLAECHVVIPKQFRTFSSFKRQKAAMQFMRTYYDIKRFVGYIPSNNINTIEYSKRCGFTELGILKECIRKDGKLLDIVITESI